MEKEPAIHNTRHVFCINNEDANAIKVYRVFTLPMIRVPKITDKNVEFQGQLTLFEVYNPNRNVSFPVTGVTMSGEEYVPIKEMIEQAKSSVSKEIVNESSVNEEVSEEVSVNEQSSSSSSGIYGAIGGSVLCLFIFTMYAQLRRKKLH